jgi:hypothetical protein
LSRNPAPPPFSSMLPERANVINVGVEAPLKYVVPQRIVDRPREGAAAGSFQLRVTRPIRGTLRLAVDGREVWSSRIHSLPERRIALGLSLDTDANEMVRAVLEGVAFRTAEAVRAIETIQRLSDPISIDGGMVANSYFCQFLADVLEREVLVSAQPELTAIGVAALASEAVGTPFPLTRHGRHIAPRPIPATDTARFSDARSAVESFSI